MRRGWTPQAHRVAGARQPRPSITARLRSTQRAARPGRRKPGALAVVPLASADRAQNSANLRTETPVQEKPSWGTMRA